MQDTGAMQRDTWNIYRGESTEDADKVAYVQSNIINILGDTVKVMRAGEKEPCITIKARPHPKSSRMPWSPCALELLCPEASEPLCPEAMKPLCPGAMKL